jgi:hypothetical protein
LDLPQERKIIRTRRTAPRRKGSFRKAESLEKHQHACVVHQCAWPGYIDDFYNVADPFYCTLKERRRIIVNEIV